VVVTSLSIADKIQVIAACALFRSRWTGLPLINQIKHTPSATNMPDQEAKRAEQHPYQIAPRNRLRSFNHTGPKSESFIHRLRGMNKRICATRPTNFSGLQKAIDTMKRIHYIHL
jgi:hypothetical protein